MVRAKFVCWNKTTDETGASHIKLSAVTTGNKENEEFFKYTPSGIIEMGVVNSEAARQFEQGKEYYIDFTPCN